MARGGRGGGVRNIIGSLISAALLVFALGGWWLYRGGPDGGLEGCLQDSANAMKWLAEQGRQAIESVFGN